MTDPRRQRSSLNTWLAIGLVACVVIGALVFWPPTPQRPSPQISSAPSGVAPGTANGQASSAPAEESVRPAAVAQRARFSPTARTRSLQVISYPHFTVGYDPAHKTPAWVAYDLDGPIAFSGPEPTRPAIFSTDFNARAHVAHRDYTNSGYDRGHLCPAYAQWSRYGEQAFRETFVTTNIVPQLHAVNAGIWEELESSIAGRAGRGGGWAERRGQLTVINGPVFDDQATTLRAGVPIPRACFSIVLDYHTATGAYDAIAFIIPNLAGTRGPLTRYLVTIERIERETGLDIFAGTPEVRAQVAVKLADRLW